MSSRRRHAGNRDQPEACRCLGIFGLSLYTTERDLREVFSKYGPLSDVNIVYDQQSRRSRGFAFVYFENYEDSKEVKRIRRRQEFYFFDEHIVWMRANVCVEIIWFIGEVCV